MTPQTGFFRIDKKHVKIRFNSDLFGQVRPNIVEKILKD